MVIVEGTNPLLDEWRTAVTESEDARRMGWFVGLRANPMAQHTARERCRRDYAYAVPTSDSVRAIAALGPVVEIGAGNGYWAWQLQQAGCDVVAYDPTPPGDSARAYFQEGDWFPVQRGDHRMAKLHPDRTLLLVWPCYNRRWAYAAVRAHLNAGGTRVAYVGEWRGCMGDARLHGLLERCYTRDSAVDLPTWSGLHDQLHMFTRRPRVL